MDIGIGAAVSYSKTIHQASHEVWPTRIMKRENRLMAEKIEAHQGTITVKTEIGKGSTFTFAVPIEVKTF